MVKRQAKKKLKESDEDLVSNSNCTNADEDCDEQSRFIYQGRLHSLKSLLQVHLLASMTCHFELGHCQNQVIHFYFILYLRPACCLYVDAHPYVVPSFERQTAVIKVNIDAEREHLLTQLRLLRSNFKEQLQIPLPQFLEENTPNLSVKLEEGGRFEVEWKDKVDNVSVSYVEETNMHESLLQQISKACPDFVAGGVPSVGGVGFSRKSGKDTTVLGASHFQIPDFVMEELSESQYLGLLPNAFQTPGRLSVGTTPKTSQVTKAW